MRRTNTGRPATASAAAKKGAGSAVKKPTTDDQMDYIMNLKGQVYLLTLENEMMKKSIGDGPNVKAYTAGGLPSLSSSRMTTMASTTVAAQPALTTNELLSAGLPQAQYPGEISDAFEMMRQKYAQLESKYQQDLDEARRGAEALASQCAAQGSLISTLKKEVATSMEALREQKVVMQELEQRSSADLERALRDISSLHERIADLTSVIGGKEDELAGAHITMADLRSVAANATAEKNAAESARQRTLDSYGRVYLVSRYLLQRWRAERRDKLAVLESFEKMRADRVRALEDRDDAVSRAESDRVGAREALEARDRALAAHRETKAQMNVVEQDVKRLQAEVDLKTRLVADLDSLVPDMQRKVDVAQATAAKAVSHKEAAIKRANELERLLSDKAGEADALRAAAVRAEGRMREALGKVKGLEDNLAGAHARVSSLEHSESSLEGEVRRLTGEVEGVGQRAAAAEAECLQLRDELSKRPPIDIIKQLDVENLMQRNMQAAAAMQQLLAWREAHEHTAGSPVKGQR